MKNRYDNFTTKELIKMSAVFDIAENTEGLDKTQMRLRKEIDKEALSRVK